MAAVKYAGDFGTDTKFTLLEISPELAKEIESGTELAFAGGENDTMMLCTDSSTYSVKVATTSNTLYITDAQTCADTPLTVSHDDLISVLGASSSVLEVSPAAPKLERMEELLRVAPFSGLIERDEATVSGITWDTLISEVQASPAEIKAALHDMNAFEFEGRWQVMDELYAADKLTLILTSAIAEGWSLDHLDVTTVTASLDGHDCPGIVVSTLLRQYGHLVEDPESQGAGVQGAGVQGSEISTAEGGRGCTTYALDSDRICRFEAIKLLRETARWPLDAFMETWKNVIPKNMNADFAQLQGVALACETGAAGSEKEVVYYSASDLPVDQRKRLAALFKFRAEWTADEIKPYLRDIAVGGLTVENILFKYARGFKRDDGIQMYNKR